MESIVKINYLKALNKMTYNNIKKILKKQIENNVNALWTFNEEQKEFTQIYQNYNNNLTIYTPQQLLDKLKQ
tara:strand:- start:2172 stop:2387 length:216 start_codon:yes stop_codon:yes gene_type:complete